MGITADVCVAAGLWLPDAEALGLVFVDFVFTGSFGFSWRPLLFTVAVEEGVLCADVEGLELRCEALAVPL